MEGGSEIDPDRVISNLAEELSGDLICPICMGVLVDPKECVINSRVKIIENMWDKLL